MSSVFIEVITHGVKRFTSDGRNESKTENYEKASNEVDKGNQDTFKKVEKLLVNTATIADKKVYTMKIKEIDPTRVG